TRTTSSRAGARARARRSGRRAPRGGARGPSSAARPGRSERPPRGERSAVCSRALRGGAVIARAALAVLVALLSVGGTAWAYVFDVPWLFDLGLAASALALGPLPFALSHSRLPLAAARAGLALSALALFLLVGELAFRAGEAFRSRTPLPNEFSYAEAVAN